MNRAPCSRLLAAFLALSLPLSLAPSPALALRAVGLEETGGGKGSSRRELIQALRGSAAPVQRPQGGPGPELSRFVSQIKTAILKAEWSSSDLQPYRDGTWRITATYGSMEVALTIVQSPGKVYVRVEWPQDMDPTDQAWRDLQDRLTMARGDRPKEVWSPRARMGVLEYRDPIPRRAGLEEVTASAVALEQIQGGFTAEVRRFVGEPAARLAAGRAVVRAVVIDGRLAGALVVAEALRQVGSPPVAVVVSAADSPEVPAALLPGVVVADSLEEALRRLGVTDYAYVNEEAQVLDILRELGWSGVTQPTELQTLEAPYRDAVAEYL